MSRSLSVPPWSVWIPSTSVKSDGIVHAELTGYIKLSLGGRGEEKAQSEEAHEKKVIISNLHGETSLCLVRDDSKNTKALQAQAHPKGFLVKS